MVRGSGTVGRWELPDRDYPARFPWMDHGKNPHLSASFTYGMLDTIDFFIEEVKRGAIQKRGALDPS